jgi:uncharacterized membrane protein YhdT
MHLRNIDLILIVTVALMNVILALFPSHPPVMGIVLALPLVFLLPGYALIETLFYRHSFDSIYRFMLFIGTSLSIDILSGFILNILPGGLQARSWATFLGLLTVVFSLLSAYLRRGSSRGEIQLPKFRFRMYEYVLLGLSIIVAILSIEYSVVKATQQPYPDLTQLWMLPSLQTDNNCAVRLGIHSFEATSETYRLTMAVNGIQVNMWPSIVLAPQAEWERLVAILPRSTSSAYVEVRLYKSDKPETVYHEVHMTLKEKERNKDRKIQC